jgi:hypothetical protein
VPTLTAPITWYDRQSFNQASIMPLPIYRNRLGAPANFGRAYEGDAFYLEFYEGWVRRLKKVNGVWKPAPPVAGQPTTSDSADGLPYIADSAIGPDGSMYMVSFAWGILTRIRYQPLLPTLAAPSQAVVGKPVTLRSTRNPGDPILLAVSPARISPIPLPGVYGLLEIVPQLLASGTANASGHFDVPLVAPSVATGLSFHFQCGAVAGPDVFLSRPVAVKVVAGA